MGAHGGADEFVKKRFFAMEGAGRHERHKGTRGFGQPAICRCRYRRTPRQTSLEKPGIEVNELPQQTKHQLRGSYGVEYQNRSRTNGQSENRWHQAMLDPEQRLACWPPAIRQSGPENGGDEFREEKKNLG